MLELTGLGLLLVLVATKVYQICKHAIVYQDHIMLSEIFLLGVLRKLFVLWSILCVVFFHFRVFYSVSEIVNLR